MVLNVESSASLVSLERERFDHRLREVFQNVFLSFTRFSPKLQERFRLMIKEQPTFEDEVECAALTHRVEHRDFHHLLEREDWNHVQQASLFTDIGKTGPADATPQQADLITRMYGARKKLPGNPRHFTIRDFFEINHELKFEADAHLKFLDSLGIFPETDMRTFFNLHAQWTFELLEQETEIPQEVKILASLHHFLEGVNPNGLVDLSDERFMIPLLQRPVGRKELWVILFDKYQAQRAPHRGNQTHEAAIQWLHRFIHEPDLVNKLGVQIQPYPEWFRQMLQECLLELDEGMKSVQEENKRMIGTV